MSYFLANKNVGSQKYSSSAIRQKMVKVEARRHMYVFFLFYTVCTLLFSATLFASAAPLSLKNADLLAQQILVQENRRNKIVQDAVFHYVAEFDPQGLYLLLNEVTPFLSLKTDPLSFVDKETLFPLFYELHTAIQQAIMRSRNLRKEARNHLTNGLPTLTSSNLYAQGIEELKGREKAALNRFIVAETFLRGPFFVVNHKKELISSYYQKREERERAYLFLDQSNHPLAAEEREHLFSLHLIHAFSAALEKNQSAKERALEPSLHLNTKGTETLLKLKEHNGKCAAIPLLVAKEAARSDTIKVGSALSLLNNLIVDKLNKKELYIAEPPLPTKQTIQVTHERFGSGLIGILALDTFDEQSLKGMKKAFAELKQRGPLQAVMLDLRYNTGGSLKEAVKVASLFLTNGVIVTETLDKGRERYSATTGKTLFRGPLLILTSHLTSSAGEIAAHILQTYGLGLIVGDGEEAKRILQEIMHKSVTNALVSFKTGSCYTLNLKEESTKETRERIVIPDIVVPGIYSSLPLPHEVCEEGSCQLTFYTPFLQPRQNRWSSYLKLLKQNSTKRVANNKNYQLFMRNVLNISEKAEIDPLEEAEPAKKLKDFGNEDLQLKEAIAIVKDMVSLYSKE